MEHIKKHIDDIREEIIGIGEKIYREPETGFKEFKTAKLVEDKFLQMGLATVSVKEYPGIKATIDTKRKGPGLALVAEMDSVICPAHPDAHSQTGAVHACGHNAQIAAMLGAAMGIMSSGIIDKLSGKLHFIAVPAEEYIEIGYRKQLKDKGIIKYLGGKPELLRKGFFNDVDMCISVHASVKGDKDISIKNSANGCIVKNIKYIGKASHAGGSPHLGVNALYAASLGLMAINSLRETFVEDEYIRVHPIITKGGEIVNAIPDEVIIETYVRGSNIEAIKAASKKVDRAIAGSAYAMGAKVIIEDLPGYMPLHNDPNLISAGRDVAADLVGSENYSEGGHGKGSTDWGDISSLMPIMETSISGFTGTGHGADYMIEDPEKAYVLPAKYLALLSVELLGNKAKRAEEIIADFKPVFDSKEEYFKEADEFFKTKHSCEIELLHDI
jgi:amidohydrolase